MKIYAIIILWVGAFVPAALYAQGRIESTVVVDGQKLHIVNPTPHIFDYEVVKQPMSYQQVLALQVGRLNLSQRAYVFHEFKTRSNSPLKVDFHLKIVPVMGAVSVELQHFDRLKDTFQTWSRLDISRDTKFIPNIWMKYTVAYDTAKYKNKAGDLYRILFYPNEKVGEITEVEGFGNPKSNYFVAEIQSRETASLEILNGSFEQWNINEWPAKPVFWQLRDGLGCMERSRGHLLDDFALKIINAGTSPIAIESSFPIPLEVRRYELVFFARSDKRGHKVKVSLPDLDKGKSFRLSRKWKKFSLRFHAVDSASTLKLVSDNIGAFYMDEMRIIAL